MNTSLLLHSLKSLKNKRLLHEATFKATAQNASCGDEITLQIICTSDGIVKDVAFEGAGCALCLVSADAYCLKAQGADRDAFLQIATQSASQRLGFAPGPLRTRCADVVTDAAKKIGELWEISH